MGSTCYYSRNDLFNNNNISTNDIFKIKGRRKAKIKCEICGDEYADNYYKNKDTGETICEDCLLESDGVTTSTITNYFLDGEFIGDDSQSIQDVVDRLCEIFDYEQIEEG